MIPTSAPFKGPDFSGLTLPRVLAGLRARLWWILGALAGIALAIYFGTPYVFGPVVAAERVQRHDIVQTVVASGQVQTPYRVNVGSQVVGIVADVPVEEGQTVTVDQTLIRLDDTDAREAVRLARGIVAQSEARLNQLLKVAAPSAAEAQRQAQAAVADAQAAYDRAVKLSTQGFGTKATLDDARKALDVAQSQVRAADIQITTSKPGGMDYVTAETQLEQARASLNSSEVKLGYMQIRAPRAGTLITRNVERGNIVQPGNVLLVLAPKGETQIVVEIDEQNLGLMRLGETATVSADAYPKQNFQAKLFYINPSVDPTKGAVGVKLTVPDPPDYLRQDMTVSAEIEVARRPQSIAVGTDSIHELNSSNPWVLVVDSGRARRRTIAVGAVGDVISEVTSGLTPGDIVVRGQASAIADGQRVRARISS